MTVHKRQSAYNKRRFEWKKQVNASPELSRSAKHMATFLCDTYVNKDTGMCWPKNETLARDLSITKRSAQRHLKELREHGWLSRVQRKNVRRAFQISVPGATEGDSKHDNLSPSTMSNLTLKDDKAVTPYTNQGNNQERKPRISGALPLISIRANEEFALKHWTDWLKGNTKYEVPKIFELLRRNGAYMFPARFPKKDEAPQYLKFFQELEASDGAIIP